MSQRFEEHAPLAASPAGARRLHAWLALLLLGSTSIVTNARAQNDPFDRSIGGGTDFAPELPSRTQPTPQQQQQRKEQEGPETHAASSGEALITPGQEPTLPEKPLEYSDEVKRRIGSDFALERLELGKTAEVQRRFYGLYYEEDYGSYEFKTVFPFWLERNQPSLTDPTKNDRASLYGGLYYNRRSATDADDVLFPIFWNFREPGSRTTIAGPFVNRVAPGETDNWLAPLYFIGTRKNGGYTVLPPLLTYSKWDETGGFSWYGLAYCSFSGGPDCDRDTAKEVDRGVFPLYFDGQDQNDSYRLIPPLLHYHSEDKRAESWLDIWGPLYRAHDPKRDKLHVFPLYYSLWGQGERHTTLLPLFHYGYDQDSSLFVNPLFLTAKGSHGESTFVTWGYARYRGRTELDMVTPLYWGYRDPDIGLDQYLLFPFYYRRTSPRESDIAVFPLFGHFERYGVEESIWVTPLFRHSHGLRGWSTSLYPIFFTGRDGYDTHFVVAPVFWDFADRDGRTTIGFPLYWRFAKRDSLSQLVGNVYYGEKRVRHGTNWEVHVFPAFSFGATPDGHWWNVLYGLAGYKREGSRTQLKTFWVPITVSE